MRRELWWITANALLALSANAEAHDALSNSRAPDVVASYPAYSFPIPAGYQPWVRISTEWQHSFGGTMSGPGIGLGGEALVGTFALSLNGRFHWNFQPSTAIALSIAPYVGVGIGWIVVPPGVSTFVPVGAGAELRVLIAGHLFLALRPIGLWVPFVLGLSSATPVYYDLAFGIGGAF